MPSVYAAKLNCLTSFHMIGYWQQCIFF